MIDLLQKQRHDEVVIVPSDNLWDELGRNTYDYKDLISELIDNSIAAQRQGSRLTIQIDIFTDEAGKPTDFVIRDDATGIQPTQFGQAISPAGMQSKDSLNEHGLGMKQAVAALGKLKYLATKIDTEGKARLVEDFRFGGLPIYTVPFPAQSGTEIAVTNLKPIVTAHAATYTRTIVPYLGARYRRFLRAHSKRLDLILNIRKTQHPDQVDYTWSVQEVKPVFFRPSTRNNEPVIHAHRIEGAGWAAEVTFGYAPTQKEEYEELGLDEPNKFHPYRVSLNTQGVDVLYQGRVILFHQLQELGLVPNRHNDFNNIRGEIDLKHGFTTAITKTSIIADAHFVQCIEKIKRILSGEEGGPRGVKKNYLMQKSYPEEIPEKLLRDRLIEWLTNNPLLKRNDVKKEYAVGGIEGSIDILADNEAWELKTGQASAYDVYQLFMYMDVGMLSKGYLVAKSFTTGAKIAVDHITKTHNKEIVLTKRDQFPINHPPDDAERAEYY
jgi:histidine kinase/DNA gyrase B/HSP90-like ATPase